MEDNVEDESVKTRQAPGLAVGEFLTGHRSIYIMTGGAGMMESLVPPCRRSGPGALVLQRPAETLIEQISSSVGLEPVRQARHR